MFLILTLAYVAWAAMFVAGFHLARSHYMRIGETHARHPVNHRPHDHEDNT